MPFWKRYYYSYLAGLINFIIPEGKTVAKPEAGQWPTTPVDYLVIPDGLSEVRDVLDFLQTAKQSVRPNGRLVLTQFNALWEPILRLASFLGLRRRPTKEQNWLTRGDLRNFATLAGWEIVRLGTKMPFPFYVPLISFLINNFLAEFWPLSRLGLFHYLVLRPQGLPDSSKPASISIVVPARNEAGTIQKIVEEIPTMGSKTEIIFIEGHSTDHTWTEIERVVGSYHGPHQLKLGRQTGRGKGDAVRLGFSLATGDILAIYDADMTVPPKELPRFYEAMTGNKADFINGSRLVYRMEKESMRTLNLLGNKFFSLAFSWILGQSIKDTLCGTKVLWRNDYEAIKNNRSYFGDFDPFGDFDLILGAAKLNLKIIDLPVHYGERIYGSTNISRFRHGWLLLQMTAFAMSKLRFK